MAGGAAAGVGDRAQLLIDLDEPGPIAGAAVGACQRLVGGAQGGRRHALGGGQLDDGFAPALGQRRRIATAQFGVHLGRARGQLQLGTARRTDGARVLLEHLRRLDDRRAQQA